MRLTDFATYTTRRSAKLSAMHPDVLHCEMSSGVGYAMNWHSHDCPMLLLPRRGSLLLSTEDGLRDERLSSMSFSVVGTDIGHATSAAFGEESHLTLYVEPDYLNHYGAKLGEGDLEARLGSHGMWGRSDVLSAILMLYDRIEASMQFSPSDEDEQRSRLFHLNHLLFDECMRIVAQADGARANNKSGNNTLLIRQVQQFIGERLELHHDIDMLCQQFHLSRRHLTRLFREVTGESIVDYANRQRVEHARRLIGERGMSVLQAGLAVGIDSPSYLARLFKKHLGALPSAFRKRH